MPSLTSTSRRRKKVRPEDVARFKAGKASFPNVCVLVSNELLQWKRPTVLRTWRWKRRNSWETSSTTKPNVSLTTSRPTSNPGMDFLRPTSSLKVCASLKFVVNYQENLGRGEEAEHGDIWRPRTFPEGKGIWSQRSWRPGDHSPANPAKNWKWGGVKTFFFSFEPCWLFFV